MEDILLIYEVEKRFPNLGKDELNANPGGYRAFGTEFAKAIKAATPKSPPRRQLSSGYGTQSR